MPTLSKEKSAYGSSGSILSVSLAVTTVACEKNAEKVAIFTIELLELKMSILVDLIFAVIKVIKLICVEVLIYLLCAALVYRTALYKCD